MKGIITIAIGTEFGNYANLLAKTLRHHHEEASLAVISDLPYSFFDGLFDHVFPLHDDEQFRTDPFFLKLHLHRYSPFDLTLFLDADTIAFHNIDLIWQQIENHNQDFFTYGYTTEDDIEYETEVSNILKIFNTSYINVHNGGLYAFKKTAKAWDVFELAKSKIKLFDEVLPRTNKRTNHVSDEILFSYAMCQHNMVPHTIFLSESLYEHINCTYSCLLPSTESVTYHFLKSICNVKYSFRTYKDNPILLHYANNPVISKGTIYSDVSNMLNSHG